MPQRISPVRIGYDAPAARARSVALGAGLSAVLMVAGCASQTAGSAATSTVTVTETVSATVTETVTQSPPAAPDETTDTGSQPTDGSADPPVIRTGTLATPDPCSLLTQDEAGQLAGRALPPGISSGPDGAPTMCQFTSDPNEPGVAQVTVQVGDGVKKYLDIDKDTLGHEFVQVSDLGEEAWQEDNAIFVRQADLWIGISLVLLNDPAANVQPLQVAARIAVGRL